ncbi:MAG: adenine deaminase, partial [Arcticibacterium sp.]
PVKHYKLPIGLLLEGHEADFIRVQDLENFQVLETYVNGKLVALNGQSLLGQTISKVVNNFEAENIKPEDLKVLGDGSGRKINVIKVNDGQLITDALSLLPKLEGKEVISDTELDVLKMVVYNRYQKSEPAIAFIHGFGLKKGAIASSVAHDSHNIIAIGVNDAAVAEAINLVIRERGGISAVSDERMGVLGLPIAGLMSDKSVEEVALDYEQIDKFSKEQLGATLSAPFMSLSFMALLVIPSLKLSDKGLFDGGKFEFKNLFEV